MRDRDLDLDRNHAILVGTLGAKRVTEMSTKTLLAALVMAGYAADASMDPTEKRVADCAVRAANALLDALAEDAFKS